MPHCFGGKDRSGLLGMDWDVLMQHSQIDLFGGLVATRAVAPYIEKEGGGAIVCTSCTAAWLDGGHYAVAKAGLNALVQSLARELGPKNIRINAIAPGMTDTAAMQEQVRPEWIESQLENLAIKRLARRRIMQKR
ncbi:MAG TPA: SDR family oxidoreductase [Sphingobium sp.]